MWPMLELRQIIRVLDIVWCSMVFLFCFVIEIDWQDCSNLWKMVSFMYFRLLWSTSTRIWASASEDNTVPQKKL